MTDVGTETAFRLDQRKHFRKSKHFVPKGIISGVRVQAGLYLDTLDADRSPNAVSVPAGTMASNFRHLTGCEDFTSLSRIYLSRIVEKVPKNLSSYAPDQDEGNKQQCN